MSRVETMDEVGISKACMQKVMMNSPMTSTEAIEATNSGVVSLGCTGCCFCSDSLSSFMSFANVSPILIRPASRRQAQNPPPTHIAESMGDARRVWKKFTIRAGACHRVIVIVVGLDDTEVYYPGAANGVLAGDKSPVTAVQA